MALRCSKPQCEQIQEIKRVTSKISPSSWYQIWEAVDNGAFITESLSIRNLAMFKSTIILGWSAAAWQLFTPEVCTVVCRSCEFSCPEI